MRRVVFLIADLGAGGAQRVMALLANALAEDDVYRIDVISLSESDQSFFPYPGNVKIHYAGVVKDTQGIWEKFLLNVRRSQALRRLIKSLRPDVVISFMTETNVTALLGLSGLGVPLIISERSDPYEYPEQKTWRILRRITYPFSSHLVCQTQHAAGFFPYLSRKSVIYNPLSAKGDALSSPPFAGEYILGVGRHSAEKRFDLLVRAHAEILAHLPELKLVLLGDGPDRVQLETLAEDLGSAGRVIFAGRVNDPVPYYRNARLFVMPSRYEGMPNAMLEAMMYSCPVVVTSDFRAVSEFIDHDMNGVIVRPDPVMMASEMIFLLQNPDHAHELAQAAYKGLDRYGGDHIIVQWRKLIESQF